MGIRGMLKDYVMRVSGAGREIEEMEARVENGGRDLRRVLKEADAVRRAKMDCLVTILTGVRSPLDDDALGELGINVALIGAGREHFNETVRLDEELRKLRGDYLGYVARNVCEAEGVSRVPVMVYGDGHVVYGNRRFERRFSSMSALGVSLKDNKELNVALARGDGFEVPEGKGSLVFVSSKKDIKGVHVAYFLHEERRLRGRVGDFRKRSERAVGEIYSTLRRDVSFV